MKAFRNFAFLTALLLTGLGCGSAPVPLTGGDQIDVTGTVTLANGQPLKSGAIYFEPAEPGKGREDLAAVTDGKFTSKIVAGKYKVAFDMQTEGKRTTVPLKFQKYETSGMTAEVKSGMTPLAFELK